MAHATLRTFGYPDTLVREYDHWAVLMRPRQATLGALVLVCRHDVTAFARIGEAAFKEMACAVHDIETALAGLFAYDKINYLMLMMVDPQVHFHVLPRYAETRHFETVDFADPGWPGPPDLGHAADLDEPRAGQLLETLRQAWPA